VSWPRFDPETFGLQVRTVTCSDTLAASMKGNIWRGQSNHRILNGSWGKEAVSRSWKMAVFGIKINEARRC